MHSLLAFTTALLCILIFFVRNSDSYTHHPEYINCKLPDAENTIVVYNDATWQQCVGQNLEIQFCVADIIEGDYNCVKHSRVRQTMKESWMQLLVRPYYLAGSEENFVDCEKLRKAYPNKLYQSDYKLRCLQDISEAAGKPAPGQDQLCLMEHHHAILIQDYNVQFCNNYNRFEIERCLVNVDNVPKCVSKTKFAGKVAAEELNKREFCSNFYKTPDSYLSDYKSHVIDCNAFETVEITPIIAPTPKPELTPVIVPIPKPAPTPVIVPTPKPQPAPEIRVPTRTDPVRVPLPINTRTEVLERIPNVLPEPIPPVFQPPTNLHNREEQISNILTPQFIDCTLQSAQDVILVYNEITWYQCINGKLEVTCCITRLDSTTYLGFDYTDMRHFYEQALLKPGNENLIHHYVGNDQGNHLGCAAAVPYVQRNGFSAGVREKHCSQDVMFRDVDDVESELCSMANPGFSIRGLDFYSCYGDYLLLSKCIVASTGAEYKCVPKLAAENVLNAESISVDPPTDLCYIFNQHYESNIQNKYQLPLQACNDFFPVDNGVKLLEKTTVASTTPAVTQPAPDIGIRIGEIPRFPAVVSARLPYPPVQVPVKAADPKTRLPYPPVQVPVKAADPKMCKLEEPQMNGKCIHLDEFIRKYDNLSSVQLPQHIDYGKLSQNWVTSFNQLKDMTLGQLFQAVPAVTNSVDASPTKTLFNLAKLMKKNTTDCTLLSKHHFVTKESVQDLLQDCPTA